MNEVKENKTNPDYLEVWKKVVNYTFGEGSDFSKKMINIVNGEGNATIDDFKELIVEMRNKLIECGYVECVGKKYKNTDPYNSKFPLASLNNGKTFGIYTDDGIKYEDNNCTKIEELYKTGKIIGHPYYNELDHYFTHVLNFYPLLKDEEDRKKLLALQIQSGRNRMGNAKEPGIYAVICDSFRVKTTVSVESKDEYKKIINSILKRISLKIQDNS